MEDISHQLQDLAQNSIAAKASLVEIYIKEITEKGCMYLRIHDNGKGMDQQQLDKISDPFYTTRTSRKVGLGVPLFKASAEATGGYMRINSAQNKGTILEALFNTNHIDCLPLGKPEESLAALIFLNSEVDFVYCHEVNSRQFRFDTREVRKILGEVSITEPEVIDWIKKHIKSGLDELYGGA